MTHTLVLGYGNTIRGDDGAGAVVAEELATRNIPGVDVRVCQQLQLDLVPDLLAYDRVILVDASMEGKSVAVRRLTPIAVGSTSSHHITPETLLQAAKGLYDADLEMYLCAVRGESFELGVTLSPEARVRCTHAVQLISTLIQGAQAQKECCAPSRRPAT